MLLPPRYAINPAAQTKPLWAPAPYQVVVSHRNGNYLNSLWLGFVWNTLVLPYRIAREFLWNLFNFELFLAALSLLVIPVSYVMFMMYGLRGKLKGVAISLEESQQGVVLNPNQSEFAVATGHRQVLIDMSGFQTQA